MWTSKRKIETLSLWGKSWYRKESLKILVGIGKRSSRGLQHQGTLCIGWGGGGNCRATVPPSYYRNVKMALFGLAGSR